MRYFDYMKAVMAEDSGLKANERLVAACMALYGDFETGANIRPSVSTVCAETSLKRTTVYAAIRTLKAAGWLVVTAEGPPRALRAVVPRHTDGPKGLSPDGLRSVGRRNKVCRNLTPYHLILPSQDLLIEIPLERVRCTGEMVRRCMVRSGICPLRGRWWRVMRPPGALRGYRKTITGGHCPAR
jgi:hypothetical protein